MFDLMGKLATVREFINSLSWRKLFQFFVFLLIIGTAWAVFENRESVYNYVTQGKLSQSGITYKISPETSAEVKSVVDRSAHIVAAQIVMVDFQRNTRTVVYSYSSNPALRAVYEKFVASNISTDLPLFNADLVNNKRLIELINGEFVCYPYTLTIGAKLAPATIPFVDTVCSTGIPPFYGKFSGMMTVYLPKTPDTDEMDQIRVITKKISTMVYEHDIR